MPLRLVSLQHDGFVFVFKKPLIARSKMNGVTWVIYVPKTELRGEGTSEKGAMRKFALSIYEAWLAHSPEVDALLARVDAIS